jgi:hypothetical protein
VAGTYPENPRTYCRVWIGGEAYVLHRVVWELHKGKIPDGMVVDHIDGNIRNNNISNNFFKLFEKDAGKVDVKIVKIAANSMDVEFKMNGVTKVIPFAYKTEGDTIKATGKLDVLAFGIDKAWAQFSAVCKSFHHGKSWNEIDINFEVPASCK